METQFICSKHGLQSDPYTWNRTYPSGKKVVQRECRLCRSERSTRAYRANRDELRAYHQRWYTENKERALSVGAAYRKGLRQDVIAAYGGRCSCCGESRWEFLSVDHINGGGAILRRSSEKGAMLYRELRRRGFPKDNYRLLCMNCNFSLGRYGYCPHTLSTTAS